MVISWGFINELNAAPADLRDRTHMNFKSCNPLTRGGVVEEVIGWRRYCFHSLNVKQPAEVPNDNFIVFQSLMNVSAGERF